MQKPEGPIFKPALSATGLMPGEVVYVGDADVDTDTANAAGIMPLLIKRQDTDKNSLNTDNDSQNVKISDISQPGRQCETISSLREIFPLLQINVPDA